MLLICDDLLANHAKSSVFCSINTTIGGRFEALPGYFVLFLRHALGAELLFFAVDKETFRTQRYHSTAFRFEFEQSRCAPAPLIPCQPLLLCRLKFCTQLRVDDVFKLVGLDGHVVAVCVHLHQLEVAAINISVQKVKVKLAHPELRQLIHRDANLEWTSDLDAWLPALKLICLPELVQIFKVRASQHPVHRLLVLHVYHACLPLKSLDQLPVAAVPQ